MRPTKQMTMLSSQGASRLQFVPQEKKVAMLCGVQETNAAENKFVKSGFRYSERVLDQIESLLADVFRGGGFELVQLISLDLDLLFTDFSLICWESWLGFQDSGATGRSRSYN